MLSLGMDNAQNIIAFDLDGTLLNSNRKVSPKDFDTLRKLNRPNFYRVAATGRNHFSVNRVLEADFPIDYVVFSSGAGILNWKTKEIIHKQHISKIEIENIINTIMPYELNFTVHKEIPNNHHMMLYSGHPNSDDLLAYTSFYKEYLSELDLRKIPTAATQVIVLLNSHVHLYNHFKEQLKDLKVILTTSPVNHKSMWMEVFNPAVSKSNGLKWLANYLQLKNVHYFAIGNDYNDLDMLTFAHESFVVNNAPNELKKRFKVTTSHNESGFTNAIESLFF